VGGGRFPQVGGMAFSYDLTRPAGSRIQTLAIQDADGNDLDIVVRDGAVVGDPTRSIRMVTLDFLTNPVLVNGSFTGGGDGYPFPNLNSDAAAGQVGDPTVIARVNQVKLTAAGTSTGVATFAADGSEQDALAEFLADNHSPANPYDEADTTQALDTRLQNLAVRSDAVIDPVRVGTAGDDNTLPGSSTIPGFDGRLDTVFTGAGDDEVDVALRDGFENKVFTGSGADIIYAGTRDVITGGSGDDWFSAEAGDGNRLSGGLGNDTFIIGSSNNRALGGAGDDKFYVLGGAGTNYLNGGAGADQFWLVSDIGDRPAAKQFVMDFQLGLDKVGLQGVAFSSLSFTQVGGDTLLKVAGVEVGHFTNLSAASLNNQSNFAGLA
jgi:Ca2+-binding RTX toxin-like protein